MRLTTLKSVLILGVACYLISTGDLLAQSDTTSPELVELSFEPNAIDVSTDPQGVIVTARVTDDISGVSYVYCQFGSPSNEQHTGNSLQLISGDAFDGVYSDVLPFPAFSELS